METLNNVQKQKDRTMTANNMDNTMKQLWQDMQDFKPLDYKDGLLLSAIGCEIGLYNIRGFVSKDFTRTYNRFYKRIGKGGDLR